MNWIFYYEQEGENGPNAFTIQADDHASAFDKAFEQYGPQVAEMYYKNATGKEEQPLTEDKTQAVVNSDVNTDEEDLYLIRSGGRLEGFYVSDTVFSCFPQEGKRLPQKEAQQIVDRLTKEERYNVWGAPGLRVMPYSKYM